MMFSDVRKARAFTATMFDRKVELSSSIVVLYLTPSGCSAEDQRSFLRNSAKFYPLQLKQPLAQVHRYRQRGTQDELYSSL